MEFLKKTRTFTVATQRKERKIILKGGEKKKLKGKKNEVLPRLELGSLDSKSKVLTITPQDQHMQPVHYTAVLYHLYVNYLLESLMVVA